MRTPLAILCVTTACSSASPPRPIAPSAPAPASSHVALTPAEPLTSLPQRLVVADAVHGRRFEACRARFRPTGDVRRDLEAMTALCGPPNAMHAVTPVLDGTQSAADPIARFSFTGETGRCYRVFSAAEPGVADLDLAVLDPDQAVVGHDTADDAFPVLNPDGPLCLTKPGRYELLVSVERGAGRYALQIWGF